MIGINDNNDELYKALDIFDHEFNDKNSLFCFFQVKQMSSSQDSIKDRIKCIEYMKHLRLYNSYDFMKIKRV